MSSFYSEIELTELGLKSHGKNVLISKKCSIYAPEKISVGNNVRIDDFCILSGEITLGNNVHISAYSALYGAKGIEFKDNSGCSARTTIYSAMDDFSGEYLIGPMHPEGTTHVTGGKVTIGKFVQLGAHCLVFPNVTIYEGSVVGALSLVTNDIPKWCIYVGIPAKKLRDRKKDLLNKINRMKDIKISIIVAVYNGASTLPRCLDSIFAQSWKNIEVICVNDCSPDNSQEVLEEYASRYPNMRIINHTENKNGGGADNTGIKAATGEYICIVDQDDSLPAGSIEKLVQNSHDGADDIVVGHRYDVNDQNQKVKRYNGVVGCNVRENVEYVFNHDTRILGGLLKKTLFTDNNLFYPEKVGWADNGIVNAMYICAKAITVIDEVTYNYYVSTPNSLSKIITIQGIKDRIYTTDLYYENCTRVDTQKVYTDTIRAYYLRLTIYTIELLGYYSYKTNRELIDHLSSRIAALWSDAYKEKFSEAEQYMLFHLKDYIDQREAERKKQQVRDFFHGIRHYIAKNIKSLLGIKSSKKA